MYFTSSPDGCVNVAHHFYFRISKDLGEDSVMSFLKQVSVVYTSSLFFVSNKGLSELLRGLADIFHNIL